MVTELSAQDDATMRDNFGALDYRNSALVESDAFGSGVSIWRCGVHGTPGGLAFWVGDLPEFFAYLVLVPAMLGGRRMFEGKFQWTEDKCRGQGMGARLLRLAAAEGVPLLCDREGASPDGFYLWSTRNCMRTRWWDARENRYVDEQTIPKLDRYSRYAEGARWLLVLERPCVWRRLTRSVRGFLSV